MLFNSPVYIFVFLPLVALGYFLINGAGYIRAGKLWLVCASLFFYGYWNPIYLLLIAASMLVNYGVSVLIHQSKASSWTFPFGSKSFLISGIVLNLGSLAYFKYIDFFIATVNQVAGTQAPLLNLLLPLAISFFTFQQIAYLVDTYKTEVHEYDFMRYCLFVCFFPQLIAGPIVHHREMMPQFSNVDSAKYNLNNIAKGVLIFSIGLFKKIAIADTFALWANKGYDSESVLTAFEAWVTTLSYTFQIYYDFSGYTDMAIGAALIFNIRLPLNFNSPYKAWNIQDFWRRWHMTLSRWLRDYLYIPLGGNRAGRYRTYLNLFMTFLLGGLWHGAGWTFVIWGALHGLALVLHRLWRISGLRMHKTLAWMLTFLFVHVTWVFFRAEDVGDAVRMLGSMFFLGSATMSEDQSMVLDQLSLGTDPSHWVAGAGELVSIVPIVFIAVFALVAFFSRNSMEISDNRDRYSVINALCVSGSLLLAMLMGISTSSSVFLYFNF